MPHRRERHLKKSFLKQTKLWPVVALLGPRQCGKSTFLRELLWKEGSFTFLSLDKVAIRRRAEENPELLLSDVGVFPLVIDEVQKAPSLFDEIKSNVDAKRVPGKFIISGSVQFSKKVGIRESLTGRVANVMMGPLTIQETSPLELKLSSISSYLQLGGMPGVCFLRDKNMRVNYWEQWLDTTCERDLKIFSQGRLSGDLARQILIASATLSLPNLSEIARYVRVDARRIRTHLEALQALFVVSLVEPYKGGVGKTFFLPFDTGLASFLGADNRRCWQIWFLNEWLNRCRFNGNLFPKRPQYYLSTRGSFIDFVTDEKTFHLYSDLPYPDRRAKITIQAITKKSSSFDVKIYSATDQRGGKVLHRVQSLPWKCVVLDKSQV